MSVIRASIVVSLLLLPALLLPATAEAGGALIVRGGSMRLDDTTQTLDSVPRSLDDWSQGTFSISIEGRRANGLALGFEFLNYRNNFTSAGTVGEARTRIAQFTIRKYFFNDGVVHPFLGFGIGGGDAEISYVTGGSGWNDHSYSAAVQLGAGVEFRLDGLLLTAEVKHLAHDMDNGWNDFNASGTGVFAGIGFNW